MNPPQIQIEVLSSAYRLLWLKYVTSFDISQHCAKSLLGKYSKLIAYGRQREGTLVSRTLDEYQAPYFYLCGVTGSYDRNLHVPFVADPGHDDAFENSDIHVTITGGRILSIPPIPDGHDFPKAYSTCRNFQFGHHYLRQEP